MPNLLNTSPVTEVKAADSASALAYFARLLTLETDCWDVHAAQATRQSGFVLVDLRSPEQFAEGHVAGAINLPRSRLTERNLAPYPPDTLFVVYCAGPHCNGADKAAMQLARLGRPVKKMIGGITGWKDEGFTLASG